MNIVLFQPEIPQNTGNIARTCAVTGVGLHLIEPLGFSLDSKFVKRAGLDYWDAVSMKVHSSFDEFLKSFEKLPPLYFCSTKGKNLYTEVNYEKDSYLIFGRETSGLSKDIYKNYAERLVRIPLLPVEGARSLNLSNAVAVVAYEALRQNNFYNLT